MVSPASHKYSALIDELWKDEAIQAAYNRRNELEELPRVATYFLGMDFPFLLQATEKKSVVSGASWDKAAGHDDLLSYQLIMVHPNSMGENCKCLQMFEDVDIVLFCVPLTDYGEFFDDDIEGSTNKMVASWNLLQKMVMHPVFAKDVLLLLSKFDFFEEKIEQVSLTKCEWFNDFNPVISYNHRLSNNVSNSPLLAQRAFHYIAVKFKTYIRSLSDCKLYVSLVTGLEQNTVNVSLLYLRDVIDWNEEDITVINEDSMMSIVASSS